MPVQFLKDLKNHDAETMCACHKSAISYGKKEDSEGENTDLLKGIAKQGACGWWRKKQIIFKQ